MVDPGWASRTPDANDVLLKSGTGVATTLAALSGYVAEIASCEVNAGLSIANNAALSAEWQGAANLASNAAATGINTVAQLLAGWLTEKPPLITSAVDAFTTACSSMVPADLCYLNRTEREFFDALNQVFWGWFTPEVVDRDREYFLHFWPNNGSVGAAYSAVLTSLLPALAVPPPVTPMGASPAAPAAASAAVAQSTATGTAGDAMRASGQAAAQAAGGGSGTETVAQYAQQALQPLQQGVEALPKAVQGVAGLPQQALQPAMSAMQSVTGMSGMFGGALKGPEAVPAVADTVRAGGVGGLGPTAGAGGGVGPGAAAATGLTSYTRPVSSFAQESGGRPTGLRAAGLLSAAEARGPATVSGMGGGAMPLSQAGMLARQPSGNDAEKVTRARVVVTGDRTEKR